MGERVLTVRDRIIVHLAGFSRYADDFECPMEMCQSGISVATSKSRAHVTLELNRMRDAGILGERVAHVKGARSKRKTYFLTPQGMARSSEINRFLESLNIEVAEPDGPRHMNGSEAVDYVRNTLQVSRVTAVDNVLACDGVLEICRPAPEPPASGTRHLLPAPDYFAPRTELDILASMLKVERPGTVVLLGIPGIGKTSVLAELPKHLQPDTLPMYRRIYSYDSAQSVVASMDDFFAECGHQALGRYMANQRNFDLAEAGIHISNSLAKGKFVIMLDECDQARPGLEPLFAMLSKFVQGTGSALVLASSKKPEFYSMRDTELERSVRELTLSPLDRTMASALYVHFLEGRERRNPEVAGGHPLSLKLLAAGIPASDLAVFVEDTILGKKTDIARACRFAAVLRKPFHPEDMELLELAEAGKIRQSLAFEPLGGNRYVLHPAISTIISGTLDKRMLREMHARAAAHYIDAGTEWQEALHHLVKAGDKAAARVLALDRKKELLASGNPEELATLVLEAASPDDDPALAVIAAEAMDAAGRWEMAMDLALRITERYPGNPESARAGLLRARILSKTGQLAEAMKALEGLSETADKKIRAEANYTEAGILRKLGKNTEARKKCEKAIERAKSLGDEVLHARCLMESAMIMYPGSGKLALERLKSAMMAFRDSDDVRDRIRCGINSGIVLMSMGKADSALQELEEAVELAGAEGLERLRAQGIVNLTDALNRSGKYDKSAKLAPEAETVLTALGEWPMAAAAMLNRGVALAGLGNDNEAKSVISCAASLMEERGIMNDRKAWLAETSELLREMGKEKLLKQARKGVKR